MTTLSFIVGILLEFLILYLLIERRLQRRLFWFVVYIAYEIVESALRFIVTGNRGVYYKIYWWTEIGEVALMALAFRESFLNVLREYTRLRWFVSIVWGCIGAALLYALFQALVSPPLQANRRGVLIIDLEVAIDFVLCVSGILYFALIAVFRIKGHRWESGIISGFTIYVALAISGFLIRSIFGTRFPLVNQWLSPIGYLLAEATWVLELGRRELPVSTPTRDFTVDDLTKLEQYSTVLKRFWRKKP